MNPVVVVMILTWLMVAMIMVEISILIRLELSIC